jgi:alanyl-tRNA synthetase
VAKGIRRVTGVTGEEAVRAVERASALLHEINALTASVSALVSGSIQGDALTFDANVIAMR